MTRKLITLGLLVAIVIAISGDTVAGTSPAQEGRFSHVLVETSGDSDVVAVVEGKEVTRGVVRKPADFYQTVDPSLTRELALKLVIVGVIDEFIIQAEVERRGLVPTEAEAKAFMQPNKDFCLGPEGEECRESITQFGSTVDEYWGSILPEYQNDLGEIDLRLAVIEENGLKEVDNEQVLNAIATFHAKLRTGAVITWHDDELERLYGEALESR